MEIMTTYDTALSSFWFSWTFAPDTRARPRTPTQLPRVTASNGPHEIRTRPPADDDSVLFNGEIGLVTVRLHELHR